MMKHLLSATLILLSTLSYAEEVPNTFSSGETISSSQINANFSFLADAMARGSLTAMMQCKDKYIIDSSNENMQRYDTIQKPEIAFSYCIASDNTTFTQKNYVCTSNTSPDSMNNWTCNSGSSDKLVITTTQLLENNWLLTHINASEYWFYKISNQ